MSHSVISPPPGESSLPTFQNLDGAETTREDRFESAKKNSKLIPQTFIEK